MIVPGLQEFRRPAVVVSSGSEANWGIGMIAMPFYLHSAGLGAGLLLLDTVDGRTGGFGQLGSYRIQSPDIIYIYM